MDKRFWTFLIILAFSAFLFLNALGLLGSVTHYDKANPLEAITKIKEKIVKRNISPLDTVAYDKKINELANNPIAPAPKLDPNGKEIPLPPPKPNIWPVKTAYPNAGAILPFSRIIAYYGNLYSTKMGVLGQYPEEQMLAKLEAESKKWEAADPSTPVVPALHYIAVVAQGTAGAGGKYIFRMPDTQIQKVLAMAEKIGGIVFLDIQVGLSNVETEIPLLEKYLKLPNVHLGIDPEFSMKTGVKPGKVIGTLDAKDINFATEFLAKVVKENNLTPKVLVIHRFTRNMVTNYKQIKIVPEVQFVMDMDGWGFEAKKINTYKQTIYPEPVQFTGFKLFYKNDTLTDPAIMTPEKVLKLTPRPIYIQYQ